MPILVKFVRFCTHCLVHARRDLYAGLGRLATLLRRVIGNADPRRSWPKDVVLVADSMKTSPIGLVRNALVLGREGCLCDARGRLIGQIAPRAGFLTGWAHPVMQRLRSWRLGESEQEAILLSGGHPDNYYHWMFEVLPRVLLLEQHGVALDRCTVLAPQGTAFQRESLSALGFAASKIRALTGDEAIPVGLLHCTLPPFSSVIPREEVCRWLGRRLGHAAGGQRRLLLHRRRGKRSIANFDEMVAALAPEGFEVIVAEKLTVAEQIETFASAECVIAPHGAGLSNLVFCRPGTRVIEIISADYRTRLYGDIAADCGLCYSAIEATPVGRWWELREGSKQMRVNVKKLPHLLGPVHQLR